MILTLHTDAPLDREGYSVKWKVVEYEDDQEVPADCVTWSVSEAGTAVTLTGNPGYEGQNCEVSAIIYYSSSGEEDWVELCREETWVNVRENEYWLEEYEPECFFVPGDLVGLSYDAEAGGITATLWVRDDSHPYGEEIPVLITGVTERGNEDGKKILSVTKDENGNVIVRSRQKGETVVSLNICDADSKAELNGIDISVYVIDDCYLGNLWTEGSAVSGFMLPDDELTIKAVLYHIFSADGEATDEIVTPENYRVTYSDYDPEVIRVDDAGHVTAVNRGITGVRVTFSDIEGNELPGYASRWIDINVTGLYYTVEPVEEIILEPGADYKELNLVTKEIRITAPEGRKVDNVVYEAADWNGDLLEVKSDKGRVSVKAKRNLTEEDELVDTFLSVRSSLPGEEDVLTKRQVNVKICCHTWERVKVTTAATCGSEGMGIFTCRKCGKEKTDAIPATGRHSYGKFVVTKQPTAIAKGKKTHTCKVCGYRESVSISTLTPTIRVNATSVLLKIGQSTTCLKVTGLAAGDSVKSWTSQNTKIVKVSSTGKLTAQKKRERQP